MTLNRRITKIPSVVHCLSTHHSIDVRIEEPYLVPSAAPCPPHPLLTNFALKGIASIRQPLSPGLQEDIFAQTRADYKISDM